MYLKIKYLRQRDNHKYTLYINIQYVNQLFKLHINIVNILMVILVGLQCN